MSQRNPFDGSQSKEAASQVTMDEAMDTTDLPPEKRGTAIDRKDMQRMGKQQEFKRNFSFIPIFGFAAVLMMTWASVLSSASYVLPNGGLPAMIWIYVVTLFGFGCAILSMAEMASMAPTSGGQYHWVSEFAPKSFQKLLSYLVGWFCVLGWQAGIAGQCFTVASQVQGLIVLNDDSYVPQPWHAVLLTIAAVTVAVVFNSFFARKLPLVEGLVLILLIFGFFAVLIPLWVFAPRQPSSAVWTDFRQIAGWPSMGVASLVAFTGPIYALIGPDSAVHMAEEVKDASRTIPLAMVSTLILNGLTGLVMAITFAYCIGPVDQALSPKYYFAFIGTFYNATQSRAGATVMTCIITTLTLCSAISNVATASRQIFAFARDHGLPFARILSYVQPGLDIPLNAVILCFVCTCLLALINLGSTVTFNAILSIGVVALLTSYLTSMGCILIKRIRAEQLLPRRFDLGVPLGWFVNVVGLIYIILAYIFAFFPLYNNPTLQTMNWASAVYGGIAIVATFYYIFYARHIYVPPVSRLAKDL
ncbi:Putative amino acid/polyamine transporter I [Septoria linicola]|uniref:Amino acid/polyamine transporter I n=1 Tax=Septoria linicola TaxID=215465 RepID=A0A9Q9ELA3_9PEZI|nr:Putative amino acid/polyamine transporter I [Septoria linicola]